MTETSGSETPPPQLLEAIGNLTEFHREHEKYYSQAPLRQFKPTSRPLQAAVSAPWANTAEGRSSDETMAATRMALISGVLRN